MKTEEALKTEGTFEADVVQFLRPNRMRHDMKVSLPIELEGNYREMLGAGFRFEAEVLVTDQVSVTISTSCARTEDCGDIDISLTVNGPGVIEGMARMLRNKRWETLNDAP